jgi:hypothetical protein
MTTLDELEAIRDRHETINYGIVYYGVGWDDVNAELVHADRAALLAHVDQLDAERKALRALCLEAAEFYGYGGTFPIRGAMAMRLTGAALGALPTRAQGESS